MFVSDLSKCSSLDLIQCQQIYPQVKCVYKASVWMRMEHTATYELKNQSKL